MSPLYSAIRKMLTMITVACPECQEQIKFGSNPEINQQITCPSCNTVLIVTWLYPISLEYPENPGQTSAESGNNVEN